MALCGRRMPQTGLSWQATLRAKKNCPCTVGIQVRVEHVPGADRAARRGLDDHRACKELARNATAGLCSQFGLAVYRCEKRQE